MMLGGVRQFVRISNHLLQAKSKPYVLDDDIVEHVIQVYTKQLELTLNNLKNGRKKSSYH